MSPPDNIFALPAEAFSSCLAIVSAVMVGGLFLWMALRYGTGYQTVWEIRPSAETSSSVHCRHFYFQLTRVHSALELFGRCALQIYLLMTVAVGSGTSGREETGWRPRGAGSGQQCYWTVGGGEYTSERISQSLLPSTTSLSLPHVWTGTCISQLPWM